MLNYQMHKINAEKIYACNFRFAPNKKNHVVLIKDIAAKGNWSDFLNILDSVGQVRVSSLKAVHAIPAQMGLFNVALKFDDTKIHDLIREKVRTTNQGMFVVHQEVAHEILLPDLEKESACEMVIPTSALPNLASNGFHVQELINIKFPNKGQANIAMAMRLIERALRIDPSAAMGTVGFVPNISFRDDVIHVSFVDNGSREAFTSFLEKEEHVGFQFVTKQNVCGDRSMLKATRRGPPKSNFPLKRLEPAKAHSNQFEKWMRAMASVFTKTSEETAIMPSTSRQANERDQSRQRGWPMVVFGSNDKQLNSSFIQPFRHTSRAPYIKFEDVPRKIEEMNVNQMPDTFRYDVSSPVIKNFCSLVASGEFHAHFAKINSAAESNNAITEDKKNNKTSSKPKGAGTPMDH